MIGWVYETLGRIRSMLFKSREDRNLEAEMAGHIEMLVDENMQRGMEPHAARRQALMTFGSCAGGTRPALTSANTAASKPERARDT